MSRVVLLDAGPLGLVTHPRRSPQSLACAQWLQSLVAGGTRVILPEIADYEVRRELLRANKMQGLARLDASTRLLEYLPLTTTAMRQAVVYWAQARQQRASRQRETKRWTLTLFLQRKPRRLVLRRGSLQRRTSVICPALSQQHCGRVLLVNS